MKTPQRFPSRCWRQDHVWIIPDRKQKQLDSNKKFLAADHPVGSDWEMPEGDHGGDQDDGHRVPLLHLRRGQPRGSLSASQGRARKGGESSWRGWRSWGLTAEGAQEGPARSTPWQEGAASRVRLCSQGMGQRRGNGLSLHQGRFRLDINENIFMERVVKHQSRLHVAHGTYTSL